MRASRPDGLDGCMHSDALRFGRRVVSSYAPIVLELHFELRA